MMGRERNRNQLRLIDVEHLAGAPVVPAESFYGKMAEWGALMVTDDQFADLYAKDGRASVPPGLCAKMLLLRAIPVRDCPQELLQLKRMRRIPSQPDWNGLWKHGPGL